MPRNGGDNSAPMHARFAKRLVFLAGLAAACSRSPGADKQAEQQASERGAARATDLYALAATTLEGEPVKLATYRGKVSLLVNVASECGYTSQYAGLQRLYERYGARGFTVLAFPCNDFDKQEPGTPEQIRAFCTSTYHVSFPLFAKVQTKPGAEQSPIYAALERASGKLPSWNFGKYLLDRQGKVLRFFESDVEPESAELVAELEAALKRP